VRPVFARTRRSDIRSTCRTAFYRARNGIYHLFAALEDAKARTNERLVVLVPDYNSGNEVLAIEAAGAECGSTASARTGRRMPPRSSGCATRTGPMCSTSFITSAGLNPSGSSRLSRSDEACGSSKTARSHC
jgi:hypothetical protein